jgi:hypothetical protein
MPAHLCQNMASKALRVAAASDRSIQRSNARVIRKDARLEIQPGPIEIRQRQMGR